MKKNQQMYLLLHTLFIDHTYMFQLPSAIILRVYNIKEYNKKFVWWIKSRSEFRKCYKILKLLM
jgi:hypothetical protein